MAKIHDEASTIGMAAGAVTIDGPGGVAVTLTPEAAAETADRLLECADQAFLEREGHVLDIPGSYIARARDHRR